MKRQLKHLRVVERERQRFYRACWRWYDRNAVFAACALSMGAREVLVRKIVNRWDQELRRSARKPGVERWHVATIRRYLAGNAIAEIAATLKIRSATAASRDMATNGEVTP